MLNHREQENARGDVSGGICPHCGNKGRLIDTQTVKAMLAIPLYVVRAARYFFCPTAECPIVYFSEDGEQCFVEEELRERVYQKHPTDEDGLICYCFGHTLGAIRAEWQQTSQSTVTVTITEAITETITETITAGTQTGQCACDIRNPQGSCCLGNVRRVVQQMTQAER